LKRLLAVLAASVLTLGAFGSIPAQATHSTWCAAHMFDPYTVIHGTTGPDTLNTGAGNDCVDPEAGNDTIRTEGGKDGVVGSDGTDYLYGGADVDQLYGGKGDDGILGGDGADELFGGPDDDSFWDGDNPLNQGDFIDGGTGNNQLFHCPTHGSADAWTNIPAGNVHTDLSYCSTG